MNRAQSRVLHLVVLVAMLLSIVPSSAWASTFAPEPLSPQEALAKHKQAITAPNLSATVQQQRTQTPDTAGFSRRLKPYLQLAQVQARQQQRNLEQVSNQQTEPTKIEPPTRIDPVSLTSYLPLVLYPAQAANLTSAGGNFQTADGNININIPAGAVSSDTWAQLQSSTSHFSVHPTSSTGIFFELSAVQRGGTQLSSFNQPVGIAINHAANAPPAAIYRFEPRQGIWQALESNTDTATGQITAQTSQLGLFALLNLSSSTECEYELGEGSTPVVQEAFLNTYNALNPSQFLGCPSDRVSLWDSHPSQEFDNGGMIIFNATLGTALYLDTNYKQAYIQAGGPSGFLGLPIQHSTAAEMPAPSENFQDRSSNFSTSPIQDYEGGFVGFNSSSGSLEGSRLYPRVCSVSVTAIQKLIPVEPTPEEPNPPPIEKRLISISAGGVAEPSPTGGGSFSSMSYTINSSTTNGTGPLNSQGSSFMFSFTDEFEPDEPISFNIEGQRAVDNRYGFAPADFLTAGTTLDVPVGYGTFTLLSTCGDIALPGGGVYSPPADTTPPVIGDPELSQNGTGGVSIRVQVTDNVAVASVTVNIDGTDYPMLPRGGDTYEMVAYGLAVGTHEFYLEAVDTSGNLARKPESGVYTFEIEKSGYYGVVAWQGYSPDPVNTNIGNFIYEYTDFQITTPGPDLVLERFYNAQSSYVGVFGQGWTTILDMHLVTVDNLLMSGVQVRYPDGRTVNFTEADGVYKGEWVLDRLEQTGSGFVLIKPDNTRYSFNEQGQLSSIEDRSSNSIDLTWNGDQLSEVTASNGQSISFSSDADGKIQQLNGPEGLSLRYSYIKDQLTQVEDSTGGTVTYEYDQDHGMTRIITPEGHDFLAEQTYDDQGRVTHQVVGENFINDFAYDDENRTVVLTDTYGNELIYVYDEKDRLIELTNGLGASELYTYNDDNQRTTYTNFNGHSTSYEYNDNGDRIKTIDALGNVNTSTYDDQHRLLSYTDALGRTTSYEYDTAGRVIAEIDPLGQRTENTYNDKGQLLARTDTRGFSTTYAYDTQGNLITMTDALGNHTSYEYDDQARRTKTIDALGRETQYRYDENSNLIEEIDALGNATTYAYDQNNNRISETDARGNSTFYNYNRLGSLVSTTSANGAVETILYDDLGHELGTINALGHTTLRGLDSAYRVISETNALSQTVFYSYDAQGNRITATNARGFSTSYEYDALNRLIKTIDPLGGISTIVYDEIGNRVAEIDPRGAITTYIYDELNRVIEQTDALGYTTTNEYDAAGNLVKQTNALGFISTTAYNALNRPITITDALGNTTTTTYDAVGNIIAVTDALGHTTETEYDALNQPVALIDALGNTTTSTYDEVGNISSISDATGSSTQSSYDVMNRPVEITDALGHQTSTSYDLLGQRISQTDANGNTTLYMYDALGRTSVVTDALGFTVETLYDESSNIITTLNQHGVATTQTFDALDRLTSQTNGLGYTTEFAYDAVGNLLRQTDALGFATTSSYDLLNRKVAQTNALGFTTSTEYDALSRPTTITFANGAVITKEYDALNRVITETDAEGYQASFVYNAVGNLIEQTDFNGNTTTTEYDALRRPVHAYDSIGAIKQTSYNAVGNPRTVTDGNGHTTSFSYDALQRQIMVSDPTSATISFGYDAVGNQVAITDGNGHTTELRYDARNQLIAETNALGHTTNYRYDGVGNKTHSIDALGIVTLNRYDAENQLIAVGLNYQADQSATANTNVTTQYEYDAVGNRVKIINPNGHAVIFEPDAVGQLITETDPLSHTTIYQYDSVGNQVGRTDANDNVIKSYFDLNGSLLRTLYPDGSSVSRTYDGNRNGLTVTDHTGMTSRSYDARNRLLSETTERGTVAFTYDLANNRLSVQNADGTIVQYEYFADNQLQAVINPDGATTTYERDGVDQVIRQINGNNTVTVNQYDEVNHMLSTATHQTSGKLIASVAYVYNPVDQRTQAVFNYRTGNPKQVTETYRYDELKRLIEVNASDKVQTTYRYDATGNRLTWHTSDDPRTPRPNDELHLVYTYDAADQLLRAEDLHNTAITSYRYDANGNRIEQQTGREGTEYRYDAENRLTVVQAFKINGSKKRINHEVAAMLYDGDGRRVAKAEDHHLGGGGIQTTTYVYDGLDPIATYETWHPQHQNLYRADQGRILTMDSFAGGNDGQTHWFSQDALGNTLALSKFNGQAEHHYSYDAFGAIKPANSGKFGPHNPFTFTGQEYDRSTGLYHFYARDYDPISSTWLTRDPYRGTANDPQSLHRYGYVKGDPINLIDLYGYTAKAGKYGKPIKRPDPFISLLWKIKHSKEIKFSLDKYLADKLGKLSVPSEVTSLTKKMPIDIELALGYKVSSSVESQPLEGIQRACQSINPYLKLTVKAEYPIASAAIASLKAGIKGSFELKGSLEACVESDIDLSPPDLSQAVSLHANVTAKGSVKAYIKGNVNIGIGKLDAEAGIKGSVEYPLIDCTASMGASLRDGLSTSNNCFKETSQLEFDAEFYGFFKGKIGVGPFSYTKEWNDSFEFYKGSMEVPSLVGLMKKFS